MKPQTEPYGLSASFKFALMTLLVAACCVVDIAQPVRLVTLAAIALACPVCARIAPKLLLRRLAPLLSFVAIGLVLVLLAPVDADTPTVGIPYWGRDVSAQAAAFLATLAVKSTLVVLVVTAFSGLLTERDVILGLRGLHVPGKIVDLTYMMLRSVGGVRDEVVRLIRARDSRGRPRGLRGLAVAGAIARVLLIRLAQRAEAQAFALCSRGYANGLKIADRPRVRLAEVLVLGVLAVGLGWLSLLA